MGWAYSVDLRERVVAAFAAEECRRESRPAVRPSARHREAPDTLSDGKGDRAVRGLTLFDTRSRSF
jgi:hypothetical protein